MTNWIIAISSMITASGVLFAAYNLYLSKKQMAISIKCLQDDHAWRKSHYTSEILIQWNRSARKNLAYLNQAFPDFQSIPDFIANPKLKATWQLNQQQAEAIFHGESEVDIQIRNHLIELLNFFEGVAIAWEKNVVDREVVQTSCGTVMVDTYTYFEPFILKMTDESRRPPWPPIDRLVDYWREHELRQLDDRKAKEKLDKAEEHGQYKAQNEELGFYKG